MTLPSRQQPSAASKAGKDTADDGKQSQLKQSCKSASKFILSRLALILAVSLYAVAGGFIFEHLESTNEKQDCVERMNQYLPAENDTVNKMWTILSSYRSPGDAPYAVAAYHKQLSMFRDTILSINYDGSNCTAMGEPDGPPYQWSLSGAILFSTTVFTTVGYGNIAPKTFWGRLVCIAYAVLGIPLMLLTLANIGEVMANIFRYTYLNVCCCGFLKRRPGGPNKSSPKPSTDTNSDTAMQAWKDRYNAGKQGQLDTADAGNPTVLDDDDEDEDEDLDKVSVPLTVTLFLVGSYVFLGALLFGVWDQLDWMAGAYFSFITIATVGFGDIVPGTNQAGTSSGQLMLMGTAVYMILGMAILSMAFNLIQEEIVEKFKWLGEKIGLAKKDEEETIEG